MKNISKYPMLVLACLFFISQSTAIMSQEVENQTEFDYMTWSGKGPDRWGDLHAEWSACKLGRLQSPIDLLNNSVEVLPVLGKLNRTYKPTNATLKNRGHDIMCDPSKTSRAEMGAACRNSSSKWFDLEAHLVHFSLDTNATNKIAVLGILYQIGQPDPFLDEVRTISKEQMDLMRAAVHDNSEQNARPLQPLNDRDIHLYKRDKNQHMRFF
ncbi:hypothetical protein GIB67_018031 [Kingdonia uniflora]|uniref:Alpha-carbonic anhydrase domain-containing protein n=1 Tax=Kingdonia uniflora TaxID=39325 RepID=A0A7J7NWE0_9MAGN|nr:hypothetical protein GIB67_018031 [Kingdonia uniflora]